MEKNLKRMATMQRMQSVGLEIFYKNGYYDTSVDDILKELSLSKGAFYYHFKSKEEFFISILQNIIFPKVYSELIAPFEGQENPAVILDKCFDNALETAEHNVLDNGFVLSKFMTEFSGKNETIVKLLKEMFKVWEVNLITNLQKGKTDGFIDRHVDSEAVASFLMSSYMGVRVLMINGNAKLLRYKYIQQLRSYFKTIAVKR
ncbi:TetR/AcrR family transcriptional regulator [Cellulophaga lytica]|uniref:Regulatory protein TetR n=1 Tax=Cellulophaga lytica (strain ATCC 23178 / DSM 7489 / JCM 8516 / NBRC 14961 / NCIMB 1423 / VKM B-1433 / Cy l20) TaxID=867900 RepID=F0RHT2_CELLC|nr:TetR/AcrR family transcriptional regulator [Cellulophaga lytica]ADY29194.1 regulatory protein TetR [Cellulophaga lytica DSM 7489]APU10106.1 transcriptional regulator [Cellulophaga lytica]MDO6851995.1 TetR/AcrR family transcriptional regulator [Cellulophaga lytica]WQG76631.1 TetR/AcrR family transcriptional regulator [Cellulophaga lytica]SNQ44120.1 TetR-type transcriptional regulator [Cellulophaga lytica]